ncbi:GGDEF domain-containing protein [Paenibacillus terrae]|uniref:Chemotaxis protein CheY n=1 Tax=Paenibacillus terrae TaxID=159743 RepID=A0A0D7X3C0_9BACL|nr:GGDEF domain-containing protein [Paenibacillus terrae]KJD45871.1 chemotaxis protein CheY [Paenibacillus terrae]
MNKTTRLTQTTDYKLKEARWIRRMFLLYWMIIAVHFIAQLGCYLFLEYHASSYEFYVGVLIVPTLIMCGSNLLAELVHYKYNRYSFVILFMASTVICWTIIRLNYDVRIIPALCLLPIFSSILFFNRRLIWFSFVLQVGVFLLLLAVDGSFRTYLSFFDIVAILIFLIMSTFIAIIIQASGRDLLLDLYKTQRAHQELMISNAIISKMSMTDGLTKLYNHLSFQNFYEKALEYAEQGAIIHLALLDIDNFKKINDNYGHQFGDKILESISLIITEQITANDIAARYGGEEFAILMFEHTFEEAYQIAENIRHAVEKMIFHEKKQNISVTVSIGLKSYTEEMNKDSFFQEADDYLYQAKRSGKNKIVSLNHIA